MFYAVMSLLLNNVCLHLSAFKLVGEMTIQTNTDKNRKVDKFEVADVRKAEVLLH